MTEETCPVCGEAYDHHEQYRKSVTMTFDGRSGTVCIGGTKVGYDGDIQLEVYYHE